MDAAFSSVQLSHSVMSSSLRHHGLQHARPPCPTPAPMNLLKLMSIESVTPSSHLVLCHPLLLLSSIFPASGSFPMSLLFTSGGQSIAASASASVFPKKYSELIYFKIDWFDLHVVQGTLKSNTLHLLSMCQY